MKATHTTTRNFIIPANQRPRPSRRRREQRLLETYMAVSAGILALPAPTQADVETRVGVNLNGSLWGNAFNSSIQFEDDFGFSNYQASLSTGIFRADAGAISARWGQLGFAGNSFQGLSLGFPRGKTETTLLAGQVEAIDVLGRSQSSPLLGLRSSFAVNSRWSIAAGHLLTPNAANGGKSLTQLSATFQPRESFSLNAELAHSPGGSGLLLSSYRQGKRLKLASSWRQANLGLSSAGNPNLATSRNGGDLSLGYRFSRALTLDLNGQRFSDGRGGHSNYTGASLSYASSRFPSISLFIRNQDTQTSALAGIGSLNLQAKSAGILANKRFGQTLLSLGYDRLKFEAPLNAGGLQASAGSINNRVSLGLARPIGKNTFLSFRGVQSTGAGASLGQNSRYLSLDASHRLNRQGLTFSFGLDAQASSFSGETGQSTGARIGAFVPVGKSNAIGVQYRSSLSSTGRLGNIASDQLYLTYTRRIQVGGPVSTNRLQANNLSEYQRRQLGKIAGYVFEDLNTNGLRDVGEPGIPDVELAMWGQKVSTGTDGSFSLTDVRPGEQTVNMDATKVPIELALMTEPERKVQVESQKTATLAFPVLRTGDVSGTVYLDSNRNGQREEDEPGVADAIVRIEGHDAIAFTAADGTWAIHNLPPRQWNITVDTSTLATDLNTYEVISPRSVAVAPQKNEQNVTLGIALKDRPVVFTAVNLPR